MPRPWTSDLDPDSARLPEGMTRVGYDADTQRYTYRDSDGSTWVGGEGNRYGRLTRAATEAPTPSLPMYKASARQKTMDDDHKAAWRYLAPFITLCVVFVLWMLWLTPTSAAGRTRVNLHCAEGAVQYVVRKSDTCWDIAQEHDIDVLKLKEMNKERWTGDTGLSCDALLPGERICVPDP